MSITILDRKVKANLEIRIRDKLTKEGKTITLFAPDKSVEDIFIQIKDILESQK